MPAVRRPGGRAAEISRRVAAAVLDIIVEDGIEQCTIPNVAARSGVQRSTLYRRYVDRWPMIIDAVLQTAAADVSVVPGASFADDLRDVLWKLARTMETPVGAAAISVAAVLRTSPDRELAESFFAPRLAQLDPMFDAAIARGELNASVNRGELFAMAAGPIHFRTLIEQKPADPAWVDSVVAAICRLYGVQATSDEAEAP